jgi:hypothetical protein
MDNFQLNFYLPQFLIYELNNNPVDQDKKIYLDNHINYNKIYSYNYYKILNYIQNNKKYPILSTNPIINK